MQASAKKQVLSMQQHAAAQQQDHPRSPLRQVHCKQAALREMWQDGGGVGRLPPPLLTSLAYVACSRGLLTWLAYVACLRGLLTWLAYVACLRGLLTWVAYVGCLCGLLMWVAYVAM